SKKAIRFRQWATKTLKEYIQKGFVLNDEMMKNGHPFGKDYFDELLERIREIRASERRAYQKTVASEPARHHVHRLCRADG
ncbi:RhuM family protein, partial [Agathobaculum sp.]|uniref:RhuM family protein n=1 Tax=Agathobaculum sp. TaxID=2048138 RepID=UPI003AB6E798